MRITAIEPSGNLYGSEHALFDIIRGTTARGTEWDVVTTVNGAFADLLSASGIAVRTILPRDSHLMTRRAKFAGYIELALHVAKSRPAVLYLNQAGMLRSVSLIASWLRIPLVCQVQTLEDAQFLAASERLRDSAISFICNSKFISEAARISSERVSTFYQPIFNQADKTATRPPVNDAWRVGILGRIARSKGHYVLLEAARKIIDRGRNDIQFVVIGEGLSKAATLEFQNAVDMSGLAASFEFRGFRTDVGKELERLHVLVMPSLAEPLGRVVLDACVARRPIILSDSAGLGEFSRALDVGIRVPPGDAHVLATVIEAVLDNYQAEHESFGKAAAKAAALLAPDSYLDAVTTVLSRAANRQSTALEWFGGSA